MRDAWRLQRALLRVCLLKGTAPSAVPVCASSAAMNRLMWDRHRITQPRHWAWFQDPWAELVVTQGWHEQQIGWWCWASLYNMLLLLGDLIICGFFNKLDLFNLFSLIYQFSFSSGSVLLQDTPEGMRVCRVTGLKDRQLKSGFAGRPAGQQARCCRL